MARCEKLNNIIFNSQVANVRQKSELKQARKRKRPNKVKKVIITFKVNNFESDKTFDFGAIINKKKTHERVVSR